MSRYYCHEYPDVVVLETRVVDARPGAVLLDQSPFHPGRRRAARRSRHRALERR